MGVLAHLLCKEGWWVCWGVWVRGAKAGTMLCICDVGCACGMVKGRPEHAGAAGACWRAAGGVRLIVGVSR